MTQLVRFEPSWVTELEREMDALFGGLPALRWYRAVPPGNGRWAPPCDMLNRDGNLVVRLDLPGIDPGKDVQVTVEAGMLCIRGERREPAAEHGGLYRRQWRYGAFEQGITLPEGVTGEGITASYTDGVLEVIVPKAAPMTQPRTISVTTASATKTLPAGQAAA